VVLDFNFNYLGDIMGLPAYSGGNTRGYRLEGKLYFFEFSPYRGYSLRQVQNGDTCIDCSDGQTFRDACIADDNLVMVKESTIFFRFTDSAKGLAIDLPNRKEYENNLK
jgi:hypothetical protein